jgi:hypothetical protein
MELPSEVEIGGMRFQLVVRDLDEWGKMSFDGREIALSTKAVSRPDLLRETLRHEMTHAAFAVSGISFADGWEEEAVVRCLDNILFPAWERIQNLLP